LETSSVMGIGQRAPLASLMLLQTLFRREESQLYSLKPES
jgi:hypothetical protein